MTQVSDVLETTALIPAYRAALAAAESLWEDARRSGRPDAATATTAIETLAAALPESRRALVTLATLEYDGDYTFTFTHMVNVAILTMALADASGISRPLLREFGVAALLHDIGKVRTPPDILGKPGTLTEEEFAVIQRHTVDGAQILEATPDVPPLAAIVAFEHHLRLDGTGYPGVTQRSLSFATMLCSIVDVYDAMHSRRGYQPSFPTERIFAVLRGNEGRRFDQMLVQRFGDLVATAS